MVHWTKAILDTIHMHLQCNTIYRPKAHSVMWRMPAGKTQNPLYTTGSNIQTCPSTAESCLKYVCYNTAYLCFTIPSYSMKSLVIFIFLWIINAYNIVTCNIPAQMSHHIFCILLCKTCCTWRIRKHKPGSCTFAVYHHAFRLLCVIQAQFTIKGGCGVQYFPYCYQIL